MKKWLRNTIEIILFLIVIILGASVIGDLVDLIIKDNLNKIWIYIIKVILIFIMILLLSETKTIKNIQKDIFGKDFRKKK